MNKARIGIVTISDRASRGDYEDRGGPAIRDWLTHALASPWEAVPRLVADEQALIEAALRELSGDEACCLIVTTGGTGPAPRDVTPEATEAVCEKILPGFGERMRAASFASVPTAILSRQTAGIRGKSLIINLPGKPAAIGECLHVVFPAVPYCIDLIGGSRLETHPAFCAAFRPGDMASSAAASRAPDVHARVNTS
ncbi:MAG: molybdopterin adenylyltransferase [Azoarcus sp.]|jgi:molybdopterin adenylyltransferase|nr:molybdopterin adenylyltransferase [Azoarcus sp.]